MAYDPVKAHEYYMKYRKKGLKKGRKKGAKSTQKSLVGLSTGGLNDEGKMEWALAKEKLTGEMNAALAKAKTDEEKAQIRAEYQKKALAQLQGIKSNSAYAQAKKAKASKGSKGSSSKGGSSSKKSSNAKSSGTKATTSQTQKELVTKIKATISELEDKLARMTDEQREKVKDTIREQIELFKAMLKK